MLLEDWAFMTFCASVHILSIPLLQHVLGLKSTAGIFLLHYLGQLVHHTSLKYVGSLADDMMNLRDCSVRTQGRHFIKKYGYLNAETPRLSHPAFISLSGFRLTLFDSQVLSCPAKMRRRREY